MPDRRSHRGAHPEDRRLFGPAALAALRGATADLSWLLGRGYATPSALKVVGDRYNLDARQRTAVMRSACGDADCAARVARRLAPADLSRRRVLLDGYNVLTTIEAALAGGLVLVGRDGCYRDMASMHGTWRGVEETVPALERLGRVLADLGVAAAHWFLDSPVSNSGRLKGAMTETAQRNRWPWEVELVQSPDAVLARSLDIVVTADSAILDKPVRWFNLAREVVTRDVPGAWMVDLSRPEG